MSLLGLLVAIALVLLVLYVLGYAVGIFLAVVVVAAIVILLFGRGGREGINFGGSSY